MDHTNIPGITPGQGVPQDELDPHLIQRERKEHNLVHDEHHPHHLKNNDTTHYQEKNHPHMAAIKEKVKGLFSKDDRENHHNAITGQNVGPQHVAGATSETANACPTTLQRNTSSSSSSSSDSSVGSDLKDHSNKLDLNKRVNACETTTIRSRANHHNDEAELMTAAGSVGSPSATSIGIEHHEREHAHKGAHQYPGDHFPGESKFNKGSERQTFDGHGVEGRTNYNESHLGVGNIPVGNPESRQQTGHVSNYNGNFDDQGVFEGAYPAINSSNPSTHGTSVENSNNDLTRGSEASQNANADTNSKGLFQSTFPATNNIAQPTVQSAMSSATYNTPVGNVDVIDNQPQYAARDYGDGDHVPKHNIPGQY